MKIDIRQLRTMHPLLPRGTAAEYAHRASVGLERHGHRPGVPFAVQLEGEPNEADLHWAAFPAGDADQLDQNRITEDAAEAVALVLVYVLRGWTILRRLQRGESADWLLHDSQGRRVALEVSGIDRGPTEIGDRLHKKTEQVRRATIAQLKAACVVELSTPQAVLAKA